MELGETNDPKALVPGNSGPVTATATATALCTRGDALHNAGAGLQRIDTTEGWTGPAGDAFRQVFHGQRAKWLEAGDCFHNAATALDTYVTTLTWAQGQAADAIRQYNEGETATGQAKTQHQQDEQQAGHELPFTDPGEAKRQAARTTPNTARGQLTTAGDTAATAVGAARDKAPEKPGFWSKVGDFFEDVGAGAANVAGEVVNGVASFGNAMLNHPGDLLTSAAGVGLMVLGAGGEVGGGLLDATGVGAIPGVAVNIASAGVIATGAGLTVAGAGDLMMHASSDDSVDPMRTDHTGSGGDGYEPTEGFRDSEYSQDEIVEFVNGHTGDGSPTMGRPSSSEVDAALSNATPEKLPGQNAEKFEYKGVRVIVNYDMPWRSTSYYPGK
jgi:type VII secretion system ESX-1 substrate